MYHFLTECGRKTRGGTDATAAGKGGGKQEKGGMVARIVCHSGCAWRDFPVGRNRLGEAECSASPELRGRWAEFR